MAGLVKAKKYDWKDSNLALFGTDVERGVKKAAAETEKAWTGAGKKVGLQIWRIVKFQVKAWPRDQYGEFYNGDSYIILNTYKERGSEELKYDLHFWIGQYSTQDEYGTAAYKTVELDTLLDDKPIQHREVMDYESDLFLQYFPNGLSLLEGGAETGFRHVEPVKYKPRLLHFHGHKNKVVAREVPLSRKSIDESDVYILDLGLELIQYNGSTANKDEKFKAGGFISKIKGERGGKPTIETLESWDASESHKFFKSLSEEEVEDEVDGNDSDSFQPSLFRLSDESGSLTFSLVSEGSIPKASLDPKDVFVADTGKACYVWIGSSASEAENKNAMSYANKYLQGTNHFCVPITCLKEGQHDAAFEAILS